MKLIAHLYQNRALLKASELERRAGIPATKLAHLLKQYEKDQANEPVIHRRHLTDEEEEQIIEVLDALPYPYYP